MTGDDEGDGDDDGDGIGDDECRYIRISNDDIFGKWKRLSKKRSNN